MLNNWIDKLNSPKETTHNPYQLGSQIQQLDEKSRFIEKTDVTLLFSSELDHSKLRSEWYGYFSHFSLRIVELGKLKKSSPEFILPVIQELTKNNRVVFIGTEKELNEVMNSNSSELGLSNKLSITPYIVEIENEESNFLAYQRHLSDISCLINISDFAKASLGELRSDIKKAEPIIRDRQYVQFNLNALQKATTNSNNSKLTGLTLEEACKISKYAGHSPNLKLFHLAINESDLNSRWEEAGALILWYLLEGMDNCYVENAEDIDNQTYIVNHEHLEKPITFVKGYRTGRWWIKDPRIEDASVFIPCELEDYTNISQGNISDKFLSLNS